MSPFAELEAGLGVLTRWPVRLASAERTGAAWYGLVGALVGAAGSVPLLLLGGPVPTLAAVAAVGTMAVVSGGLHLDGLADTADALLAPDPVRAEVARRDPSLGSGGVIALVVVLAGEVAALSALTTGAGAVTAGLACVAAGAVSRAEAVLIGRIALVITRRRPALPGGGLGSWFAARTGTPALATAAGTAALVALALGLVTGQVAVPVGSAVGAIAGSAVGVAVVAARGQLDGDGIGAAVEGTFVLAIAAMATIAAITRSA